MADGFIVESRPHDRTDTPPVTRSTGPGRRSGSRVALATGLVAALVALGAGFAWWQGKAAAPVAVAPPAPKVTVSAPLQEVVATSTGFLGQFSAVDTVELRPQVGGTLLSIGFTDGQIVHKGDTLFTIDPRPFQVKLDQAIAQLQTGVARQSLASTELWRARQLKQTSFGTAETVDQREADLHSADATVAGAKAAITDAQLDLEFAKVTAPFTGRIGAHQVSTGSLVSGSRAGTGPTTLLATIVSMDPIYLDFDMSEADYLAYINANPAAREKGGTVQIDAGDDGRFTREGRLDFIDNAVNRSSGTIHARATVPNHDLSLTPGQFARLLLQTSKPAPALLVPAAAIVPDQSQELVMTVAPDGTVVPKPVHTGPLFHGLRVVKSGLSQEDRVIIDGLMRARPGTKVAPAPGTITPEPSADAS